MTLPPDFAGKREARLRYGDSDFRALAPGDFVRCALSGKPIPLDALFYWSVERQEAYFDAEASLRAEILARESGKSIPD